MATCKDCFHYEACVDMLQAMGYTVNRAGHLADNRCRVFKDRNFVTFQKWIPVSEWLPDEDGSYLVTTTTGTVTTARYYVSKFFPATKLLPEYTSEAKWQSNRNVTHWMPLPEPPKED